MSTSAVAARLPPRSVAFALVLLTLVALGLRLAAGAVLSPHVDEAESVIAARMVETTGVPVLPSGVLFLQGFTLSYVLPLFDRSPDPFDLQWLRAASALFGAACVPATWLLARTMGAGRAVAFFAAAGVALDGSCIEWGAHVRPYAALQLVSTLTLVAWARLLDARSTRIAGVTSILFAVGVFTHVGIALWLPSFALLAWRAHGTALLGERRDLLATLLGFAVPLVAFVGINTAFGVTTSGTHAARPSFIGDHLVALSSLLHPQLDAWQGLFQASATRDLVPNLLWFVTAVLVLRRGAEPWLERLLTLYLGPILLVALLTTEAQPRYLLHIHPLTWILLGAGLLEAARVAGRHARAWRAFALLGAGVVAVHLVDGAASRLKSPFIDADYRAALKWLEPRHQAGEPVIASITSVTWFSSIPQTDFVFLAGPAGSDRTTRYTRHGAGGETIDYWSGVPAITSTPALCAFLRAHPDTWLVIDGRRLRSIWAYKGPMEKVIRGASEARLEQLGLPTVYHALPEAEWSRAAAEACSPTPPAAGPEEPEEEPAP